MKLPATKGWMFIGEYIIGVERGYYESFATVLMQYSSVFSENTSPY